MAFNYAARDYDTIKQELLARADRVFPEWTDRDPSDFGMLLIDLWASMGDVLHYYIDRAAGEAFLPTATQRESVLALANLLDYVPRSRTSAAATLVLQNSGLTSQTVAPKTEFIARYDNKTYHCYTPTGGTAASASSAQLTLQEGQIYTGEVLTPSATGQSGQVYTISRTGVVPSSLEVFVYEDGVTPTQYQQVSRISVADTGDRVFAFRTTPDKYTEVQFGTTLNGFVPPAGSQITVNYAVSSGAEGNLPANSVIAFKNAAPTDVTIVSSSAFVGGVNEESVDSLKRSIPSVIAAQNRAVTRDDFVALALQVDGVAKATIAFTPGSGTGASATNASVTVYPQPARSDYLTTVDVTQAISSTMRTDVVEYIQPRALLGVTVLCASTVTWQPIDVSATVYVNERYVSEWVKRDVQSALDELFDFDNVFFGQRLTLGQLYRIIHGVPGVDYAVISKFALGGGAGVANDILVNSLYLPKKGTMVLTMSGGITTS